ncbi:glutamate 5-kinase [Sporichthya brevicatena]|uniref:Glutamate 5-kinase n=1 Tax=Sporichthya brevicatena TaxID=171442 RepID=A0ABN1H9G3_9ACTN
MTPARAGRRGDVLAARRVVVKIGSSSLTTARGGIDNERVDALVDVIAARRKAGVDVVLVSSGAIAAGLAPLSLKTRPKDLATQQAAASVGQGLLVARYAQSFARYNLTVGQVLLTAEDMIRRAHHRNAQRTLYRLLEMRAVPIVNENDTVATHEIRFGDNDRLAALVAHLVHADLLVLLSDVDGLYDGDPRKPGATLISEVRGPQDLDGVVLGRAGSAGVGTGGMTTKVDAARIATTAGIPVVLAAAASADAALTGGPVGTHFTKTGRRAATRLLWLAHATTPRGSLTLDAGAVKAVVGGRKSLLPAGVTGVAGTFVAGDPVDLLDENGHAVARGLVNFDAAEIPGLLGRSTRDLAAELGPAYEREIVHRDDLVLLRHSP